MKTGEAFHFIHSVHENKYHDYVEKLVNQIGTYHPITATMRLLKAVITPFIPRDIQKAAAKDQIKNAAANTLKGT